MKSIRQISQRDEKATNIQINNKKNQKKYEAGLSDKNKGKENKIGKAPDSLKKKKERKKMFSVVVLPVFPYISDLEQAGW